VIRLMGVKQEARAFMQDMGVPVLPGSTGRSESPEEALEIAEQIGYPVILKASAGGGGRGMRVVEDAAEDLPGLARAGAARGEAAHSSVRDVYLEKYIAAPRHIEFQISGR
jgi:acetyl-CoA carboxylase biotin carboxylase subunit